jgi:hypothetical protein
MKEISFKFGKIYKVTFPDGKILIVKLKGSEPARLQVKDGPDIEVGNLGMNYSIEEIGDEYEGWGI